MPGGDADAYKFIEPIVTKVAAQVSTFHLLWSCGMRCLPHDTTLGQHRHQRTTTGPSCLLHARR
jgi:hypothetical protein